MSSLRPGIELVELRGEIRSWVRKSASFVVKGTIELGMQNGALEAQEFGRILSIVGESRSVPRVSPLGKELSRKVFSSDEWSARFLLGEKSESIGVFGSGHLGREKTGNNSTGSRKQKQEGRATAEAQKRTLTAGARELEGRRQKQGKRSRLWTTTEG